jgi:cyclophilin family peptidyl-prolyl cis-trans isomerase
MTRLSAIACGLVALSGICPVGTSVSQAAQAQNPIVTIETSKGLITIELFADKAPATVANFLKYVDSGFYENTVFHRVIGPNERQPEGFMIQGGGFVNGKPLQEKQASETIKNEATNKLTNLRGTLAMARTPDPDSASAQFFINLSDNDFLNHRSTKPEEFGYAVFGKVLEGMDVVDSIARVETGRSTVMARGQGGRLSPAPFEDVPTEAVVILSAKRKPVP